MDNFVFIFQMKKINFCNFHILVSRHFQNIRKNSTFVTGSFSLLNLLSSNSTFSPHSKIFCKIKYYKLSFSVNIIVDSALATNTNTSLSKQNLSIHSSKSVSTSIPGESIRTTSSSNILQRSLGQTIRTLELGANFSDQSALPSWPRDCTDFLSSDSSVKR